MILPFGKQSSPFREEYFCIGFVIKKKKKKMAEVEVPSFSLKRVVSP